MEELDDQRSFHLMLNAPTDMMVGYVSCAQREVGRKARAGMEAKKMAMGKH